MATLAGMASRARVGTGAPPDGSHLSSFVPTRPQGPPGSGMHWGQGRPELVASSKETIRQAEAFQKSAVQMDEQRCVATAKKGGKKGAAGSGVIPATGTVAPVVGHPWVTALRMTPEWSWSLPAPGTLEGSNVFLLAGASNIVGTPGESVPDLFRKPLVGPVWVCDESGRLVKRVAEPMHPHDGSSTGVGIGRSFARRLNERLPGYGVFLVPSGCGWGDMSLQAWGEDSVLYGVAVARARTVAEAVGGVVAGVLWHQGEADACVRDDAERYEGRMTQMLAQLRRDLDNPELPVILGEIGESFLGVRTKIDPARPGLVPMHAGRVNQALRSVGRTANTRCVEAPRNCHMDRLHFGAGCAESFGERYADAWLELFTPRPSGPVDGKGIARPAAPQQPAAPQAWGGKQQGACPFSSAAGTDAGPDPFAPAAPAPSGTDPFASSRSSAPAPPGTDPFAKKNGTPTLTPPTAISGPLNGPQHVQLCGPMNDPFADADPFASADAAVQVAEQLKRRWDAPAGCDPGQRRRREESPAPRAPVPFVEV